MNPIQGLTSTPRVVAGIARVTLSEILRDKVLYNTLVCGVLLFGVAFLASNLTFFRPERIVLNFGLTALLISCGALGVFIGSGMLAREFERRTILVALTRPISRTQFVAGKFAGLAAVLTLNWLLMAGCYLAILKYVAGDAPVFSATLWVAVGFALLQSWVLAALAVFCSSFSTTSLSAVMTIGAFMVGSNISQIRMVATKIESLPIRGAINTAALVLPNFEHFQFGTKVTYGLPVTWQFVATGIVYTFALVALCLLLAGGLAGRKEA